MHPRHHRLAPPALIALALMMLGCDEPPHLAPDAAAPDAGPVAQGSPARGDLVINEVAPRPASGPDWLELYNRSDAPVDLCGFFVTDSLDRLDHYAPLAGIAPPEPCNPTLLDPGAYLIVYADDNATLGPDHAPFKLGEADEVHVVTTTGIATDSLVYLYIPSTTGGTPGASLARSPSGQGLFYPATPSPGQINPSEVTP